MMTVLCSSEYISNKYDSYHTCFQLKIITIVWSQFWTEGLNWYLNVYQKIYLLQEYIKCKITFDTSIILCPRNIATCAHRAAPEGLHSEYRCSRSNASANHKEGSPGCLWTVLLSDRIASVLWPCRSSTRSNSCSRIPFRFKHSLLAE